MKSVSKWLEGVVLVLLMACGGTNNVQTNSRQLTTVGHVMTLAPRVSGSSSFAGAPDAGPSDGGVPGYNTGQDPAKGYQPNEGSSVPQMSMNTGGSLLKAAVIHTIYVGDYWATDAGQADLAFNDGFATAIGKSPIEGIISEYGVGTSTFGGSSIVSQTFKPGDTFTDAQAQSTVLAELNAHHQTKDTQGIYTVILPPGVIMDTGGGLSTEGIGGYHNIFTGTDGSNLYYAVICNSDTAGNGINFNGFHQDAVTITESHEWIEAETDPDIYTGWHDANTGGELGDVGIWDLDKQNPDQSWDMSRCWARMADGYAYQEEWSMKDTQFEVQPGATPST